MICCFRSHNDDSNSTDVHVEAQVNALTRTTTQANAESTVRISPTTISRTDSNTIQIHTESLYDDISKSLDPVKMKLLQGEDSFEELKHIIVDVFTDFSNKIIQDITAQLDNIHVLMGTIQTLTDEKTKLIKKNNELEYNYSMLVTGNSHQST